MPYTNNGKAQRLFENLITTYYVRDASGNVMAIYERTNTRKAGTRLLPIVTYTSVYTVKEVPQYGSERLGEYQPNAKVSQWTVPNGLQNFQFYVQSTTQDSSEQIFTRTVQQKAYELKDHLGNVRVLVSDAKETIRTTTSTQKPGIYAGLLGQNNYYAFGMLQPGRNFQSATRVQVWIQWQGERQRSGIPEGRCMIMVSEFMIQDLESFKC